MSITTNVHLARVLIFVDPAWDDGSNEIILLYIYMVGRGLIPQSVACFLSFWKPVGWPHYSCESYWKVGWHYVNIYECTILQYINPTLGCKFSCSWTRLRSALHWPGWTSKKRRIDEAGRPKTHQIRSSKWNGFGRTSLTWEIYIDPNISKHGLLGGWAMPSSLIRTVNPIRSVTFLGDRTIQTCGLEISSQPFGLTGGVRRECLALRMSGYGNHMEIIKIHCCNCYSTSPWSMGTQAVIESPKPTLAVECLGTNQCTTSQLLGTIVLDCSCKSYKMVWGYVLWHWNHELDPGINRTWHFRGLSPQACCLYHLLSSFCCVISYITCCIRYCISYQ